MQRNTAQTIVLVNNPTHQFVVLDVVAFPQAVQNTASRAIDRNGKYDSDNGYNQSLENLK